MYSLPQFNSKDFSKKTENLFKNRVFQAVVFILVIVIILGVAWGKNSVDFLKTQTENFLQQVVNNLPLPSAEKKTGSYVSKIEYEQAIIDTVKSASPSVVSIIISKNLPVYEQQFINPFGDIPGFNFQIPQYVQKGTQKQEVGAGSGFIISEDGLVLTNKHVVVDKEAEYTVLTNDGKKYSAKVLALDPVQDLAVVKIKDSQKFPAIKIGDSANIQIGQGAIAIGNALGEFRNTVSVGVISGLGRTISASGEQGGSVETLEDVIQTDAAINLGNSGGPLLNLRGEVIGINTATAQGAQAIGFAIPINIAKRDIDQVVKTNTIVYPFLGVRYILVDDQVKQKYHLSVDYGAYLVKGNKGESVVVAGSPAEKAGLKEGDVILELNGEKITTGNSMSKIILKYKPGDSVTVKVLRDGKEIILNVILDQRS